MLPASIEFAQELKLIKINQLINPTNEEKISITVEAKSNEVDFAKPSLLSFSVTLLPKPDTGLIVEPSMSSTFEMYFNSTFKQEFTFRSSKEIGNTDSDEQFKITAQKHPFIETTVSGGNTIEVKVDGPEALKFTKAVDDKEESVTINVNEENSLKFKIKLLVVRNETKSENLL